MQRHREKSHAHISEPIRIIELTDFRVHGLPEPRFYKYYLEVSVGGRKMVQSTVHKCLRGSGDDTVQWERVPAFRIHSGSWSSSLTLEIRVYCKRYRWSKPIAVGNIKEAVPDILNQNELTITRTLSLFEHRDNKILGPITILFKSRIRIANIIDESLSGLAVLEQPTVAQAFRPFVFAFGVFAQLVNGVAEVHPYAKGALSVINYVYQTLMSQAIRDERIVELAQVMSDMYTLITEVQQRDKYRAQIELLVVMVKQTEECAYFIQDYAKHKAFLTRAIRNIFSLVDEKVYAYQDKFRHLLLVFQGHANLETQIIVTHILGIASDNSISIGLNEIPYVNGARYSETEGCLPGTRESLLMKIRDLLNGVAKGDAPRLLLLTGVAGSGKSAIANTIAKQYDEKGRLASSFFFNQNDNDRHRADKVFPTIACDIADHIPAFRDKLWAAIKDKRSLRGTRDIREQFVRFILEPAKALTIIGPIVIVVDAVDQCRDAVSRRAFIKVLVQELPDLPTNIRIFLTSRPENDVITSLCPLNFVEHIRMEDVPSNADISAFVECEISSFKDVLEEDFPQMTWRDALLKKANNSFIWAAIACHFIHGDGTGGTTPRGRLKTILSQSSNLDELYLQVLRDKFDETDIVAMSYFKRVIGRLLGVKVPISTAALNDLLNNTGHSGTIESPAECVIPYMGSLLVGATNGSRPLQPLHPSFNDFLIDSERSQPFYIDMKVHNEELAVTCLNMMDNLRRDICGTVDIFLPNPSIEEIQSRMNKYEAVRYVCRHWVDHVIDLQNPDGWLLDRISILLTSNALHWIEVLSLTCELESGVGSLERLECWLQTQSFQSLSPDLLEMIRNLRRFIVAFEELIGKYALQIYHSALIFVPRPTVLFKQYASRDPSLCIVQNPRKTWPPLISAVTGHVQSVICLAFSPDGNRLASGCQNGSIWLWNARNGSTIGHPLVGHQGPVTSIAFTPDSKGFASCSLDGTVRRWDADTGFASGPPIHVVDHASVAKFVIISPDCQRIASCSLTNAFVLWDTLTPTVGIPMAGHTGPISCIVFSPKGSRLASCSEDKTIRLWDTRDASAIHPTMISHIGFNYIKFSSDGSLLASASEDNVLRVWNVDQGNVIISTMMGHTAQVKSITFSPDNRRLSSWSSDETVRIWDVQAAETTNQANVGSTTTTVVFSGDGKHFASGSSDELIRLWDGHTAKAIGDPLISLIGSVDHIVFSPDGSRFASWSQDECVKLWDVWATHDFGEGIVGHTDGIYTFSYSPDFRYIVSLSFDQTARLWDANTLSAIGEPMAGHTGLIHSVTFSPDGHSLASRSDDQTVRLWDIQSARGIGDPLIGHTGAIYSVVFSPDNRLLASCSEDRTIKIWDANRGGVCNYSMTGHRCAVYFIAFSPDSSLLASCSADRTVRLWDVDTGNMIGSPMNHTATINSVVFSPDSRRLASCSFDGIVRLWDAKTAVIIGQLMRHSGSVYSIVFCPDGTRLASCSDENTVRIWNTETTTAIDGRLVHHSTSVDSMIFSSDGRSLTSYASGETQRWESEADVVSESGKRMDTGPAIVPVETRDDWLFVDNRPILWIPLEYRGGAVRTVMKDGKITVCIGCNTGSVVYVVLPPTAV